MGVFFPIFSNNLTYCYTASGKLIHTSAGLQYLKRNYRGFFFVIFGCHPSLDQKFLSYTQRAAWIAEKKSITWVLHMPKDLKIPTFWWHPGRMNMTEFFFPHESHSRGSARCLILQRFSCSPLVLWFVLCSGLWCAVKNPSAFNAPILWGSVTTQFPDFEIVGKVFREKFILYVIFTFQGVAKGENSHHALVSNQQLQVTRTDIWPQLPVLLVWESEHILRLRKYRLPSLNPPSTHTLFTSEGAPPNTSPSPRGHMG